MPGFRPLVVLCLLLVTLSACSPEAPAPSPSPSGGQSSSLAEATSVDATTRLDLPVGGTSQHPLLIRVQPGDFSGPGNIRSLPFTSDRPEWPGYTPSGSPRDITIAAPTTKALEISFAGDPARLDVVPVIWRKDSEGGWYPIAMGDPGEAAVGRRSSFSPHDSGFVDVEDWLAGIARWARGRTEPPRCRPAPDWVDMIEPTLDILLACVEPNSAGSVERAEVKIKNNRGTIRAIAIPADIAYADVEGQPEPVRKLVRSLASQRDLVLLPAGDELRVGLARPATARDVEMAPSVSALALASELVVQLADLANQRGSVALLPALINLAGCSGLKSDLVTGVLPDSPPALGELTRDVANCLSELADLKKAVAVAQSVVAATSGVPLITVQSDAAFNSKVEHAAGRLNLAGRLAKAAKVVDLARLAYILWESVGEELGRATVDIDPATVRLGLRPKQTHVTRSMLRTAEVPAACSMPRQRLKNNKTTRVGKYPSATGSLALTDPAPQFGDIAGRGYRQAVSYYICNAGGVGWPPVVILTDQGGKLLGHVDLAELTQRAHGDRGILQDLDVKGSRVTVRWSSTTGCCGAYAEHRTVLAWRASGLIVESETITQWSADGVASDIAAAALAGDRNRLVDSRAVPTDVWRSLVASAKGAESSYASAPFDGETTDGEFQRYVLSFGFASGESTTWEVRMASSGNRYGWRMVSARRQ